MQNVKNCLSLISCLISTPRRFMADTIDASVEGVNATNTARNHAIVAVLIALMFIYPHTPLPELAEANKALFNVITCIIFTLIARSLVMAFILWLKTE